MRVKLSEKFKDEREEICNKLIEILDLDENNSFLLNDLDNDINKQNAILSMKDEIKKCFAVSTISAFKPNFDCKRPYLNIVRSILRQQNYIVSSTRVSYRNGENRINTIKYFIFRNN
jgi:hypothetical protein